LGAIYLDLGYETARDFVLRELYPTLDRIMSKGLYIDPKSHLQELTQRRFGIPPRYDVMSEAGADHDKTYTIGAYVGEALLGLGTGSSKKKAQQDAAEAAIDRKHEWMGTKRKPEEE
jgi:ribonuclease III